MSLLPIILKDIMVDRPSCILDQHFGNFLTPEDLLLPYTRSPMALRQYYRPWKSMAAAKDTGSTVACDKEKFQVNLDVQQFKPEEISVKVTGNKEITVEAKHEEKEDEHGFISRHFIRRYRVPDDYDMEKIASQLSSDGVLSIAAPRADSKGAEHREIQITQTGKPMIEKKKESK